MCIAGEERMAHYRGYGWWALSTNCNCLQDRSKGILAEDYNAICHFSTMISAMDMQFRSHFLQWPVLKGSL